MTHDQENMLAVVHRLIERTRQGRVEWRFTGRGDAFLFRGSSASVVVRSQRANGREPYEFAILSDAGLRIDGLQTEYLKGDDPTPVEAPWNGPLRELYELARQSVLDLDRAVHDLLRDLDRPPGHGPSI